MLADRLAKLERRIDALELAAGAPLDNDLDAARPGPESATPIGTDGGPLLDIPGPETDNRLDVRTGGQVGYSGVVTLQGRVVWNIGLAAESILDLPDTRSAAVLAGLGHPTRAALTRRLLAGPATTAELQQVVDGSSTGQLYHHLRTMTACGLVEQDGRGHYRVSPPVVVPAMVLLLAAADIAGDLGAH